MLLKRLFPFVLFSVFACSDPFTVDRHDLIGPRILAVRLVDGVYEVQVWNGEGVYHKTRPNVEWFDSNDDLLCGGVRCAVSDPTPRYVRYTDVEGTAHEAVFEVQESDLLLTSVWASLPDEMGFGLDTRENTEGTPVDTGLGTAAMRISMSVDTLNDQGFGQSKIRWMTAGGLGTFLELSALETDFFRADIVTDRDEVIENVSQDHLHATLFGLHIDGVGHNQWTWMDVWYESRALIPHRNRWLEVSEVPVDWQSGDTILATLSWDSTQRDWMLIDPELATETDVPPSPDCAGSESTTFDWSTLELGICTIADVDGVRIALETG